VVSWQIPTTPSTCSDLRLSFGYWVGRFAVPSDSHWSLHNRRSEAWARSRGEVCWRNWWVAELVCPANFSSGPANDCRPIQAVLQRIW
jgi:hypothetical protein